MSRFGRGMTTAHKRYLKKKEEGKLILPSRYISPVQPLSKEIGRRILQQIVQ